jgi:hypothetical protein
LNVSELLGSFLPAFVFLQEQTAQTDNSRSTLLDLVLRASPITKAVLLILLLFSIASWAIILIKARGTKRAERQSAEFMRAFERSSRWAELYANVAAFGASPLTAIFLSANGELQKQSRLNLDSVHRAMQSAAIVESQVNALLNAVCEDEGVLGVPFYGRGWQGTVPGPAGDGLYQYAWGAAWGNWDTSSASGGERARSDGLRVASASWTA